MTGTATTTPTSSTDWAGNGDLVIYKDTLYKVDRNAKVNLYVIDEDGKGWKLRKHPSVTFAPAGTVWSGPEKSRGAERREQSRAAAAEAAAAFSEGDVVEMTRPDDAARFPGKYVIVKETSAARFKLQRIGQPGGLTSPASRIRKAALALG